MNHGERAHSKLGASSAYRWTACPGSVAASENMPNRSSFFAREGTAAHEFVEFCVRNGIKPQTYEGGRVVLDAENVEDKFLPRRSGNPYPDKTTIFEIDAPMVEAALVYADAIASHLEDGDILELELRMSMAHVHEVMFGTGDAVIYKVRQKRLVIGDFKYGQGIAVEVEDNTQLLIYAIGAVAMFREIHPDCEIESVTLMVVQPRANHAGGPVREHTLPLWELEFFEEALKAQAARTDTDTETYVTGSHCRFCPAAPECMALAMRIYDLTCVPRDRRLQEKDFIPVSNLSPQEVATIVHNAGMIYSWVKRVQEHALAMAYEGSPPPGFKLVNSVPRRKIADPEAAALDLELEGFDTDDFMEPAKLRGVTALEALLGKKAFRELIGPYVIKESSSIALAPVDDPRPAASPPDGSEFT